MDKDGEDVSSKGRVLLFELKAQDTLISQGVELSLACEKDIFHGPVTSLTCLSSAGKNRLIIGAGSDINVEQWINGGLLQVGFYRATMQVLDIHHFKNFLLLSDAYVLSVLCHSLIRFPNVGLLNPHPSVLLLVYLFTVHKVTTRFTS